MILDPTNWNLTKIGGLILVLGSLCPLIPSLGVLIWGDIKAAEAMFRDISKAAGHTTSLKVVSITWAVWAISSLMGFAVLSIGLWEKGHHVLPVLSVMDFGIFTVAIVIESAFHFGVTSWAVSQIEIGNEVPAIFLQLK